MAYYSDSSDWEDLEEVLSHAIPEGVITGAAWSAEGSSEEDRAQDDGPGDTVKLTSRAYQLEMLEASLKENVIVAMDTGSGKTQVAVLRIKAELEKMASGQVIWFLAPTVPLCHQQYGVIKSQVRPAEVKIITGADNLDSWSKSTWEAALVNVHVVVSTHQVLLDALGHGFIHISTLSLIIFDEAHNCTKKHPGSRIMREFYWEAKSQGRPVPHILGLTASPVVRSDIKSLEELEAAMDAICRSPTRHREELLAHTQRPSMFNVTYKGKEQTTVSSTKSMLEIQQVRAELKLVDDPSIQSLRAENTDRSRRKLKEAILKQDTYIQRSMKTFCRRNAEMYTDLGSWAADWYIYETIRRFMAAVKRPGAITENLKDAELTYLAREFQKAEVTPPPKIDEHSDLSDKVRQLIKVLSGYKGDARGIVFVKERATTVVLGHILATHPEISKRYRTGTMVGTSFVPVIKQHFLDLAEKDFSLSLEKFRTGRLNLLVATSVLEEGIDVPACNLVICMDKPANLKSFIQRRGRARMRESHLYLFHEDTDLAARKEWEVLEAEMKRHYIDNDRELEKLEELEKGLETVDYPELRVESTGARLTIDDAKKHLEHFCATLSSRKYVDFKPDYIIEKLASEAARLDAPVPIKATVLLPVSLPQNVRQATSIRAWLSEKDACKDAAFQAYKALFEEGLLNEHLLPLRNKDFGVEIQFRPGMIEANAQYNPWIDVALAWNRESVEVHRRSLKLIDHSGSTRCEFELVLPVPVPDMPPMVVYLDHHTHFTLHMNKDVVMADADDGTDYSLALLTLGYTHRRLHIKDEDSAIQMLSRSGSLLMDKPGMAPFDPNCVTNGRYGYLVRDVFNSPYYYESLLSTKPAIECVQKVYRGFTDDPEDEPYLVVKKCPRGPGSFRRPPPPPQSPSTKKYSRILPANGTTVDTIPLKYAEFGFLMPSLIHYIGLYLTATELSKTLLAPLGLFDVSKVVDAICATGARSPTNYERIEFLGDSILKLCTTVNVAATKLRWPEGLLSRLKDSMISNARLCSAARESGLDQFVITEHLRFKGNDGERWRPPYISELVEESTQAKPKRLMSTKTLADVVESIVGVSYIDGGLPKALECMRFFLGEGRFQDLSIARDTLFGAAEPKNMVLPPVLEPLEELIGYSFREKSLLVEALTHPSFNVPGTTACFDRLEFIGDAILDHIIVQELYAITEPAPLENWEMHLLRTAAVNGDILGFLVMEWSHKSVRFDVVVGDSSGDDKKRGRHPHPELKPTEVEKPLWSFMRYMSNLLTLEREVTIKRHEELRGPILEAMRAGTHYPWGLLAQLHPQKFLSDLFESLVGAIWVDSGGFDACRDFLGRSGVLPYLRRLRRDGVHVLHPKEELGRLANSEEVRYDVRGVEGGDGVGVEYACRISIGEREFPEFSGAKFREEAKVKAATEAVRELSGRGL